MKTKTQHKTLKVKSVLTQARLEEKETKLNQAAGDLLEQLPDHAGQLVHTLSKQNQMPLWQATCGILLAVHLEGRLSECRRDPAWKDGFKTKELTCKQCNKTFTPKHIAQPYCSNDCGLVAAGVIPISITQKEFPKDDVLTTRTTPNSTLPTADSANNQWNTPTEALS